MLLNIIIPVIFMPLAVLTLIGVFATLYVTYKLFFAPQPAERIRQFH